MANSSLAASVALTSVLSVLAGSVAASEVRCVRGDDAVRRIVVEAQNPNQNVPCEVVYWKDTEEPGVRKVLWNAQTDAAFCEGKAEDLVTRLEGGGWSCTRTGEEQTASRQAAPPPVEPQPTEQSASPSVTADPEPTQTTTEEAAAPIAQPEPTPQAPPTVRAALAPQNAEIEPEPEPERTEARPEGTALDTIIQQNLVRLNDGVDGKFAAEIAAYGDLDGDSVEDGLVFFTYESQRLGQARFVAAYLFDGDNYVLAATKPLAGSDHHVESAEVQSIEDGVISLRLNILEPGDAACCPSGTRDQVLVLRNGQLIEARSSASRDEIRP